MGCVTKWCWFTFIPIEDGVYKWIYVRTYVGYPENKFRRAIEKNENLFPNHLYCHLMYIPYTAFRHSFHHCWGACRSGAPVFVSLPAMQTVLTASLTSSSSWNHRPPRKVFSYRNTWKLLGAKSELQGDDWIVPGQMSQWDLALQRKCVGTHPD
jgi:hypothetical protein